MGSSSDERSETVNVSQKGQATIPKKFRDRYGIDAPGRVRFVETEDGELVVRPVASITAFRGAGSTTDDAGDLLGAARARDREREARLEHADDETE